MDDKPFRVLLDLTDLYIENFKYVWMNVSPRELKTISDFRRALLHKIHLEREDIKLFVRDGLLLEQETVAILREDDTVKVQYEESSQLPSASNSDKESKKRHSKKRNYSEYNEDDHKVPVSKRKCKVDVEISKESTKSSLLEINSEKPKKSEKLPNQISLNNAVANSENLENNYTDLQYQKKNNKKKSTSLKTNVTEPNLSEKCETFFSFNVADTKAEKGEKKEISEKIEPCNVTFHSAKKPSPNANSVTQLEIGEVDLNDSSAQEKANKSTEEVNNSFKKKRKRRKKHRKTESAVTDVLCNIEDKFTSSFSYNGDENVKRRHIVYSPVPDEKDSLVTQNAVGVQDSPKDTFVITKNTSTVSAQRFKDYPKVSTPTQDGSCSNPSWHVSLVQSRNFVFNEEPASHPKEVTHDKHVKTASLENSEKNKYSSELQYDNLPAVNSVPEIGTSIAYKILELDDSYSPVISEYREGVIKNIDPNTEEIEIELLKHVIKPGRTGKFENLKPDELPMPDIKKHDIIRWSDVISPKHLS